MTRPKWLSGPPVMLLATLLFALMSVMVKKTVGHHSIGEILFYRGLLTVGLAWITLRRTGTPLVSTRYPLIWKQSAIGTASLLLAFSSIAQLPLATAITLNYTSSVWLAVLLAIGTAWRGKSSVSVAVVAAIAAGLWGVTLVLSPVLGAGQVFGAVTGLLAGLAAALNYSHLGHVARQGEPSQRVVLYTALGATAGGLVLASWQGWHLPTYQSALGLVSIGILGAVGQMLLTRAYSSGDQVVAASLQYSGILYAMVLGVLLYEDTLTFKSLAGTVVIIIAAIACIRLRASSTKS